MASFYFDHNVRLETAAILRSRNSVAVTARDLGLEAAGDDEHLLVAAERQLVLVTHNRKDFELLHDAWRRWSSAWGVAPQHAGILIIPTRWSSLVAADELDHFVQNHATETQLHVCALDRSWTRRQ